LVQAQLGASAAWCKRSLVQAQPKKGDEIICLLACLWIRPRESRCRAVDSRLGRGTHSGCEAAEDRGGARKDTQRHVGGI
jgi:hypothetical protein